MSVPTKWRSLLRERLQPVPDESWGVVRGSWRYGRQQIGRSRVWVAVHTGDLELKRLPHKAALLVVRGNLIIPDGVRVGFDVWCSGNIRVGANCRLRSASAEQAITVGEGAAIENELEAGTTIQFGSGDPEPRLAEVNALRQSQGNRSASVTISGDFWIGPGTTLLHDVLSTGSITVADGCMIVGSVEAAGAVRLGRGTVVTGDVQCNQVTVEGPATIGHRLAAQRKIKVRKLEPPVPANGAGAFQRYWRYFWQHERLLLGAVALTFLSELLWRQNLGETWHWLAHEELLFGLNVLLTAGLLFVLAGLTGWERIATAMVGLPILLIAYGSGIKMQMFGVPLLPSDLQLVNETREVITGRELLSGAGIGLYAIVAALLVVTWRAWVSRWSFRKRAWHITAGLFLLGAIIALPAPLTSGLGGSFSETENPAHVARDDGLLLSTLLQLRSTPTMVQAKDLPPLGRLSDTRTESIKPNIIVLLSESLWDATKLPDVQLSRDPLPTLHALQHQFPSGYMLSPQFGGGTANVEFEVLTGLSMRFLPAGSTPYVQYLSRPVDSLASIMTRKGYSATAITPWPSSYFQSDQAYKNMGFGRMISAEYMPPRYAGPREYVSDDEVANEIIQEIEGAPGPHFVFANTAENHYPYYPGKLAANEITAQGNLSTDSKGTLESYLQGCLDADRMLKRLTDYFTAHKEPTVIVFFGDHLPILGSNLQVYREAGYVSGDTDPDVLNKLYRTPLLVWDNYLPVSHQRLDISSSFVSPYVLERAGLQGTAFTDYLQTFAAKMPMLPPSEYWDAWRIDRNEAAHYGAAEQEILFGAQPGAGQPALAIINPQFQVGPGPMTVTSVQLVATGSDGNLTLRLSGRHLPPRGQVYMGSMYLNTTWQDDGSLEATVPAAVVGARPLSIQVRLPDQNHPGFLAYSNIVQY